MSKIIALHLYKLEPAVLYTGAFAQRISRVVPDTLNVGEFELNPVNHLFGPSLPGLGFLYTKVTKSQPGLNQESYVMQTVAQITGGINSGN